MDDDQHRLVILEFVHTLSLIPRPLKNMGRPGYEAIDIHL